MGDPVGNIVCGDCSAPDPEWASLNRGLLLCKECAFIHRSLGPQYSRVKSLKDYKWHSSIRKMVRTLALGSANHVWEHNLLDPSKSDAQVKKPCPGDSLEGVKRKFIQQKHFHYQFVLRSNADPFEVRNQELHSTVRTAVIDTTLRLLVAGADPNFFHPEKGTRPMHVAARNGQALQVELLFLHGAHTDAPDYLGQTPVEHAIAAGHKDLAQRIIELRYHLTDQLSYFACSETPDHSTQKHILIPNLTIKNNKQENAIVNLPPNVLEQLGSDLYDEVDRRQTEKVISMSPELSKFSIAFLPVNPNYPSVRNQTRQKFARLTDEELSSLISIVLTESKRRHCNGSPDLEVDKDIFLHKDKDSAKNTSAAAQKVPVNNLTEDDDYPLYDSVASEDDLVLTEQQTILAQQRAAIEETAVSSSNVKPVSSCDIGDFKDNTLVTKLIESEAKIQELQDCNQKMKLELVVLQRMVGSVIHENLELKAGLVQHSRDGSPPVTLANGHGSGVIDRQSSLFPQTPRLRQSRPASMCEPKSSRFDDLPARPSTTEVCVRKRQMVCSSDLVQDTTRKIVELIKVLIEYAHSNDVQGVKLTSNKIYAEALEMAASLLVKDTKKIVKTSLENVIFQVLRMKSEIPFIDDVEFQQTSSARNDSSHLLVQKVKQNCFEVGAAMKQLVSAVLPS